MATERDQLGSTLCCQFVTEIECNAPHKSLESALPTLIIRTFIFSSIFVVVSAFVLLHEIFLLYDDVTELRVIFLLLIL